MAQSEKDLPKYSEKKPVEVSHSTFTITMVVTFYWVVSLSIVFLNKYIFSASEYKFSYPLFVTWFQLVVALLLLITFGHLGKSFSLFSLVPPFEYDRRISMEILPLSLIYIGMLAMNNLCLQYVEVTFYQVARSLSILFNIIFTYTILGKGTSTQAVISCLIVLAGFIIGSYGEINFSWEGIFYGVGSSCFVALYGIYVKKKLAILDNNEWRLLHYNTYIATILLLPLVWITGEFSFLSDVDVTYFLWEPYFWFIMVITAIAGFLINIAIFLQIKVTTPLTNTISGTAKACVQTILGWFIFQNDITFLNGVGIFLSLFGSGLYSWFRYLEMKK
jgi:GDP-fucose transporter C1